MKKYTVTSTISFFEMKMDNYNPRVSWHRDLADDDDEDRGWTKVELNSYEGQNSAR